MLLKEFTKTLKIAVPLIVSNVAQISHGLIDSAMIGAIDYKQLAAAALVVNVVAIPQVLGVGITMAISPLVATANGRKDTFTASHTLFNGVILSAVVATIIAVTMVLTKSLLFQLGQEEIVATLAMPFYSLMSLSLIPLLIFFAVKQFTDSLEFTKTAMMLSLLSLPLNVFLNWILIYGRFGIPRLELYGAGLGTLITRTIIAITLILIVLNHKIFKPYLAQRFQAWKLSGKTWKELLSIGVPSSLQYGMESAAFSVSGIMIGWLGATAQAAHQIALNIASATFMAALGLSMAGSIRISNAYGRNEGKLLTKIGKSTVIGGLAYGIFCGLLFIIFKNALPYLFTNNNEVAGIAASLLILGALFQISDATQAIGVGLLRGIRDVKLPTLFVALAYWVIGIPVGYYLAFQQKLGATGIWIGFVCGLTVSSILLNARFLNKTKVLISSWKK